jgi:hypothetical protein
MSQPQGHKNDTATWTDILSARGVRREKKLASAIQDFHARLKKQQKRTLYITLPWLLSLGSALTPIVRHTLYERRTWAEIFLAMILILHLLWMAQMGALGKAWLRYRKLQDLETPESGRKRQQTNR